MGSHGISTAAGTAGTAALLPAQQSLLQGAVLSPELGCQHTPAVQISLLLMYFLQNTFSAL